MPAFSQHRYAGSVEASRVHTGTLFTVLGLAVALSLGGCAHNARSQTAAAHPPERVNRKIFAFNRGLDAVLIRPVARGYSYLPGSIRTGFHNFVLNLGEPLVFVNDLLQANFLRSADTGGRFVINTTIGIGGIFDVARHMGLPYHNADLGQTLGVWGLPPGRVVELPLFGSSNVRDTVGLLSTFAINPLGYGHSGEIDTANQIKFFGGVVDGRAIALPLTDQLESSDDYYAALRDRSVARRAAYVTEGRVGVLDPPHAKKGDGQPAIGSPESL